MVLMHSSHSLRIDMPFVEVALLPCSGDASEKRQMRNPAALGQQVGAWGPAEHVLVSSTQMERGNGPECAGSWQCFPVSPV